MTEAERHSVALAFQTTFSFLHNVLPKQSSTLSRHAMARGIGTILMIHLRTVSIIDGSLLFKCEIGIEVLTGNDSVA